MKQLLRMVTNLAPATPALAAALCCTLGIAAVSGAEAAKKHYDVPAGDAATTLTAFARESGCQIVYLVENIRGEKTQPVRGEHTALDALRLMLAGTALFAVHDEATGALVVSRQRPAPSKPEQAEAERARAPPAGKTVSPPAPAKTVQPNHRESPPVKNRTLFVLLAGWLVAGTPAANAQGTGTIEGRVFNAATGEALINARVQIDGTTRQAITDETGSFRLPEVPAGEARLAVAYLGMERESATVNVPAGGTVQREFELRLAGASRPGEVVKLDAFTVVADREMSAQALAMNEQRHAENIKNVVAIDEYGDRKGSVGQFMEFLPGVSIQFSGANPHTVSLRGFPGIG